MSDSLTLAKRLYDGELDSSWLREPLPPSVHEKPEGFEGEWRPVDNQFKLLVDALIADRARAETIDPAMAARQAAAEIEAAEGKAASA